MDDLQMAILAIKNGDKVQARKQLALIIKTDPHNELAWLWMSQAVDDYAQRRMCIEQVLKINPQNATAKNGLAILEKQTAPPLAEAVHVSGQSDATKTRPGGITLPGNPLDQPGDSNPHPDTLKDHDISSAEESHLPQTSRVYDDPEAAIPQLRKTEPEEIHPPVDIQNTGRATVPQEQSKGCLFNKTVLLVIAGIGLALIIAGVIAFTSAKVMSQNAATEYFDVPARVYNAHITEENILSGFGILGAIVGSILFLAGLIGTFLSRR